MVTHTFKIFFIFSGGGIKSGVIITSSRTTEKAVDFIQNSNKRGTEDIDKNLTKTAKPNYKKDNSNISKINIGQNNVNHRQVNIT